MKYQIAIPEPCHEDWGKMTSTQKGKFCKSCKKEVIDFTKLSNSQISKQVLNQDNLCGRFKTSQLNKEIEILKKSKASKIAASLALVSTIIASEPIFSQTRKDSTEVVSVKMGKFLQKNDSIEKFITIKGTVKDESGGLPGASILLKGSHKGTQTDFDGNFSIKIPNKKGNSHILVISYLGYKTREVNLLTINKPIVVVLEEVLEGMVMITVGMVAVKRPNIFKRIGNLFRKKENRKY